MEGRCDSHVASWDTTHLPLADNHDLFIQIIHLLSILSLYFQRIQLIEIPQLAMVETLPNHIGYLHLGIVGT